MPCKRSTSYLCLPASWYTHGILTNKDFSHSPFICVCRVSRVAFTNVQRATYFRLEQCWTNKILPLIYCSTYPTDSLARCYLQNRDALPGRINGCGKADDSYSVRGHHKLGRCKVDLLLHQHLDRASAGAIRSARAPRFSFLIGESTASLAARTIEFCNYCIIIYITYIYTYVYTISRKKKMSR